MKIVVKGTAGDNFQIKNLTTGDYIKRPKGFSGTWELDGVNPTLNNEGDLLNITGTHGGVITLNNGKNDFQYVCCLGSDGSVARSKLELCSVGTLFLRFPHTRKAVSQKAS